MPSFYDVLHSHQSQRTPIDDIAGRWMTELGAGSIPSSLGSVGMSMIPMLGSHDSGTYGVHESSDFAADVPAQLKRLPRYLVPWGKRLVSHWSRTQSISIIEQLYRGSRYFDIRLCPRRRSGAVTPVAKTDECRSHIENSSLVISPGLHDLYHLPHTPFRTPSVKTEVAPACGVMPVQAAAHSNGSYSSEVPMADSHYAQVLANEELWVTHGSLSVPLEVVVQELVIFYQDLIDHHKEDDSTTNTNTSSCAAPVDPSRFLEVIVFDVQKVTDFTESHTRLFWEVMSPLRHLLVKKPATMATPLRNLWGTTQRIFLLYPSYALEQAHTFMITAQDQPQTPVSSESHSTPLQQLSENGVKQKEKGHRLRNDSFVCGFPHAGNGGCHEPCPGRGLNLSRCCYLWGPSGTPLECIYRRDHHVILSHWKNRRFEIPLYNDLKHELEHRSRVSCEQRTQLHVLQGVLTPSTKDFAISVFTQRPRARSILEFALTINSTVLAIWEAHGDMCDRIRVDPDSKKVSLLRPDGPRHPNMTQDTVSIDGRNVLMLDFIQIGNSPLGLNAFNAVCWRPCLQRFTRVEVPTAFPPLQLSFGMAENAWPSPVENKIEKQPTDL